MTEEILAIIPARGGSKGIPRKNVRLLHGKPLISYVIGTASKSKYIDDIFVSTDDEEIAEIAKLYGSSVIMRPPELADDHIPLDPVIFHAVNNVEIEKNCSYHYVITIQPTSPLLTSETLDKMIEIMLVSNFDTLISVRALRHLFWKIVDGESIALSSERKNRQYLDPLFQETGAVVISRREILTNSTRIGKNLKLFEVPENEAVDIDTYQDWGIVKNRLAKKRIIFRVDGDKETGLGHIYRSLILANNLAFNHDIFFLMDKRKNLGINKVSEYLFNIKLFDDEKDLFYIVEKISPDIIINDVLDTTRNYVLKLQEKGIFVVNFEDLGEGSDYANLIINALYEKSYPGKNHYYGYKYECLRDEFLIFPKKEIKKQVENILLTFGGTDPNNLTLRTLNSIQKLGLKDMNTGIIIGPGYGHVDSLIDKITQLKKMGFRIKLKKDVRLMAKEILQADLIITSNGRTIYEIASIGTPCISISQNEREARHLFVHNSNGPLYLGIAFTVNEEIIADAIKQLIENFEMRINMNKKLLKFDLRKNSERVINLIMEKFWEYKDENQNK